MTGFGRSASFGGMTKPTTFASVDEVPTAAWTFSTKETSEADGAATFDGTGGAACGAEACGVAGSSRRITPAASCFSRERNLIASHLKM